MLLASRGVDPGKVAEVEDLLRRVKAMEGLESRVKELERRPVRMKYVGVYCEGVGYEAGAVCTHGRSMWHAQTGDASAARHVARRLGPVREARQGRAMTSIRLRRAVLLYMVWPVLLTLQTFILLGQRALHALPDPGEVDPLSGALVPLVAVTLGALVVAACAIAGALLRAVEAWR